MHQYSSCMKFVLKVKPDDNVLQHCLKKNNQKKDFEPQWKEDLIFCQVHMVISHDI